MKFPETSLDDAVAILNARRHNGYDNWVTCNRHLLVDNPGLIAVLPDRGDEFNYMTEFEAVAVAEKYLHDAAVRSGI